MGLEEQQNVVTDFSDDLGIESFVKDKEEKMLLVIDHIVSHCNDDAEFQVLQIIGKALKRGGSLQCSSLSGGVTNYSYKVYLTESPTTALFAKLTFDYAPWNPDKSVYFDLKRTENEFALMNRFKDMMGGDGAPVPTPFLCLNVPPGRKLLITEWATDDEQWSNQFIDGCVDERIFPKLAESLVVLHCAEVDPMFNDNVRPCMLSVFPVFIEKFKEYLERAVTRTTTEVTSGESKEDHFLALCQEVGENGFVDIMNKMEEEYMSRDTLVHNDVHAFNILVENKPSTDKVQQFGDAGSFVLCDWEMSFAGPIGRDTGVVQAWPLACAFCHAVQGHEKEAHHIVDGLYHFWDHYAVLLVKMGNKDDQFVCETYRSTIGWVGWYLLFACYMFRINVQFLPLTGVQGGDSERVMRSIGWSGLRLMQYGFGELEPHLDLKELIHRYHDTVEQEIQSLLAIAEAQRIRYPRRRSTLRSSGRRVSDAAAIEEAVRQDHATGTIGTSHSNLPV